MKIQVLGTGCSKCKMLYEIVNKAVQETGVDGTGREDRGHSADLAFQIFMTPGLAINGQVKAAGRVPSLEEVKRMILAAKAA